MPIGYTLESGQIRATITDMYFVEIAGSEPPRLAVELHLWNNGPSVQVFSPEDAYLVRRGDNIGHAADFEPVELGAGGAWQGVLGFDSYERDEHMTLVISGGESILMFAVQSIAALRTEGPRSQ